MQPATPTLHKKIAKSMSVDDICEGMASYDDCAGAMQLRYNLAKMILRN